MIASLVLLLCASQSPDVPAPTGDSKREVVLYDVRDIALSQREQAASAEERGVLFRRATLDFEQLLKAFAPVGLGEAVFAVHGADGGQASLGVLGGPDLHAWMREWLPLQRDGTMLDVFARFFEVPQGHMRALGIDPERSRAVEDRDLKTLLRSMDGEGARVLSAPRVLVGSGSRAQFMVGDQKSFVTDWRLVRVEPGPKEIADPVIESIFEGIRSDILATALPDGTLGIILKTERSELRSPVETRQVRLRPDAATTVELSLPEVHTVSLEASLTLADGTTALLGMVPGREGREVGTLIMGRIVRPRVEPAPGPKVEGAETGGGAEPPLAWDKSPDVRESGSR